MKAEIDRYKIKPEGLGEINIDLEHNGEWIRYKDYQSQLQALKEEVEERVYQASDPMAAAYIEVLNLIKNLEGNE